MTPSSPAEPNVELLPPEAHAPRFERVAVLIGLAACAAVLGVGLVLYLAEFRVDLRLVNAVLGAIVVGSAVVFYSSRPPSSLTPVERLIRSRRIEFGVLGLTLGAAVLGSIAAAAELDTARDWFMLAVIASSPVGVHFVVNTRFGIT